MSFREQFFDQLLKIKTTGRDDSQSNTYNYPYEPTDYEVLERLSKSGYFTKKSHLLDYGCGKGRVPFFMAYQTGCKAIGIEYDERMYLKAVENKKDYPKPYNVSFELVNAVDYVIPSEIDRVFFFNPFSVELLRVVLSKIKDSYYNAPRDILLFFYYPSDEYVATLTSDFDLSFEDEIDCQDLFQKKDERERILIYRIGIQ